MAGRLDDEAAESQRRYEVFDPRDGQPVMITRWRLVAKIVAKLRRLDWAMTDEGWI